MSDHDIDRTLADWFRADALATEPADGVDRALEGARRRKPRPGWLASPGSHWGQEVTHRPSRVDVRVFPRLGASASTALFVVAGLVAILSGALVVGSRLLQSQPLPTTHLGSLAYAIDGDIFVADWDGRNPVRIADGLPGGKSGCGSAGFWAEGRMWSPDGRYLAYRSPRSQVRCDAPEADTFPTVLLADLAGNVVAEFPGVGWLIPWSPDSTRVATWLDLYPSTRIGVYGVDGVRQAVLSLPPDLYGTTSGDHDPTWSSDGRSILIGVSAAGGAKVVWSVPVDGSPIERLPADDPRSRWGSTVSPDETRIAFVDTHEPRFQGSQGPAPELVVAAPDGSDPRVLASDVDQQWWDYPAWSPTGDRIAFVAGDGRELHVVDVVTGEVAKLVRVGDRELVQVTEFSPEGDRILFSRSARSGGPISLWSVDATGSDLQRLVSGVDWATGDWQSVGAAAGQVDTRSK